LLVAVERAAWAKLGSCSRNIRVSTVCQTADVACAEHWDGAAARAKVQRFARQLLFGCGAAAAFMCPPPQLFQEDNFDF
jgi:hypothetical protein